LGVKARNRVEISGDEVAHSCSNSKSDLDRNRATRGVVHSKGGAEKMGMYPNMPNQAVLGLVALFAKVAPFTSQNPRAPHSRMCASMGFSYAAIAASPMDNRRFTGDNRGVHPRLKGSSSAAGNGQGLSFTHGDFQTANQGFHRGFANHGLYSGFGGGRYGGRGRLGG
jgi:hypothetical protein